jgi:hypothetical protein
MLFILEKGLYLAIVLKYPMRIKANFRRTGFPSPPQLDE